MNIQISQFLRPLNNLNYLNNIIFNKRTISSFYNNVVENRQKYMSPSFKTIEAYDRPLVLKKGSMEYVWDSEDNKYIDLLGQNICISVGHAHPKVVNPVIEQLKEMPHCSSMFYNDRSALLAKSLVELMPKRDDNEDWVVNFVNDGSEAVDLAIQMAKVYTGRPEVVALYKGYHGLQGYAAGLTAIGKSTQKCYSSMYSSIFHTEANNISQLDNLIKYNTCGEVGAMIIESQQGYGGIYPLDDGYMKNAFNIINTHGGVTIADEVQSGYGRCGEKFWAFQMKHNDVIPDIVTTAKGMGNGVGIIGAVISKKSIADAFSNKMFFNTYSGNPVACTAALNVLKVFEEEDILNNCYKQSILFKNKIGLICKEYPEVFKEIRGGGLFLGLEVSGDTIEESITKTNILQKMLLKKNILIGKGSAMGNVFRIQPPMCITTQSVNKVIDAFREVAFDYSKLLQ